MLQTVFYSEGQEIVFHSFGSIVHAGLEFWGWPGINIYIINHYKIHHYIDMMIEISNMFAGCRYWKALSCQFHCVYSWFNYSTYQHHWPPSFKYFKDLPQPMADFI